MRVSVPAYLRVCLCACERENFACACAFKLAGVDT